ncbi:thioredoxin-disulfide reductase [Candidatus Karelsulcia muelleri]|uniref:Thioredoxin reductase n=1 Tax=Candidatus Karelsulcia muelleri PSPU TaxID=1189303 RepID=A0AAD1B0H7_9FLAO|nr:thioredoxin-disulfide reductase [Candidatus Karelsulcia muelleri]NJJ98774.1 thioredoxin-disulfide reductase [Candidatus Karelsulcia muelleri]BAO66426.1 thioredoxin reductase [Candidatus Karelsulcia muelleri PSPU]
MDKIYDCIIIGSGPAGYSSAIYIARADLNHILYTGNKPGGQLIETNEIENYPGFPKGIKGYILMKKLQKQAERFGSKIKFNSVKDINFYKKKTHEIILDNNEKFKTKTIIIATGASPKYLDIDNEKSLIGHGISTCATCDGFFYKKTNVAIIGGGDKALEEAIYLSKICNKIYIIIRKNKIKASKILENKILQINNIKLLFNNEVKKIIGLKTLEYLLCKNNLSNEEKKINVKAIFLAIGNKPNTNLVKKKLYLDYNGYIITKKGSTKTNIPGVFAAGDVQDPIYRQAITSAGTGCMAAIDVEKYLTLF